MPRPLPAAAALPARPAPAGGWPRPAGLTRHEGWRLRGLVLCALLLGVVAPLLAALRETGLAALGWLPALGAGQIGAAPLADLAALPGFWAALRLSLVSGLGATLLAFALAAAFCAALTGGWARGRTGRALAALLAPLLAVPHAALAIGLAFVIAPSGWLVRLVQVVTGGDDVPPAIVTLGDPFGLSLMLGLVLKELPFLVLVMLSAQAQRPVARTVAAGRALGYAPAAAWMRLVLPQIYPLIRLPVWAVLVYGVTVADMALILGPSNPPTLAVMVLRLYASPDLAQVMPASAGALVLLGAALVAVALWHGAERCAARLGRQWLARGRRGAQGGRITGALAGLAAALALLGGLALAALLVWSLADRWRFPAPLPTGWTLRAWAGPSAGPGAGWGAALAQTAAVAALATGLSLALALLWLEAEDRGRMARARWAAALIWLPLLVPQISLLYGLSVALGRAGVGSGFAAVVWGHAIFCFPYVMLSLSGPWRRMDRRLLSSAAALGAGPWARFLRIRLPVMLGPVLMSAAVGLAVSVSLYLPTLFLGGGRITTLATEAVTLSSGVDRRITAATALVQAALPLAAYALAVLVPRLIWRQRRGLRAGGAA